MIKFVLNIFYLGWNDVGWHNQEVLTPNMDKLAKRGVRLENHYVHPQCTP